MEYSHSQESTQPAEPLASEGMIGLMAEHAADPSQVSALRANIIDLCYAAGRDAQHFSPYQIDYVPARHANTHYLTEGTLTFPKSKVVAERFTSAHDSRREITRFYREQLRTDSNLNKYTLHTTLIIDKEGQGWHAESRTPKPAADEIHLITHEEANRITDFVAGVRQMNHKEFLGTDGQHVASRAPGKRVARLLGWLFRPVGEQKQTGQ